MRVKWINLRKAHKTAGHKTKGFRSLALIAVVICMIMGLRKNFMNEEALQVTLVNSRGWNEHNVRHPSADSPAEALRGWMSYTLALGKIGRRRSPPAALNLRQRLHMCMYLN